MAADYATPVLKHTDTHVTLPADSNQALGLAHYALAFMSDAKDHGGRPARSVLERTEQFHTDACLCGASALALKTNAPTVLRREALQYAAPAAGVGSMGPMLPGTIRNGVTVFGACAELMPEKAIAANASAVREWDSNGTNFGFNPKLNHIAGEFGHNDFYAVPIAAAALKGEDGAFALKGMVLLDEIRGRLAEVFSLKSYKVDHVVHGAIASAATFGAMLDATPEQIESAIGMVVAHAIPFRAIRHGKQLSDSKGASAAISTEFAISAMRRSMMGFIGPKDIFRNPEAIFCLFEKPEGKKGERSPFDLVLGKAGDDFAVMGMHFKLGLYEHQSAGAHQAIIDLLTKHPHLLSDKSGSRIKTIRIVSYEPAFSIIGDPAKRDPRTRQSADHSMAYIIGTLVRKALEQGRSDWKSLMLMPEDYDDDALFQKVTRSLMSKIEFEHGGPDYDRRYPDGIPTSVVITDDAGAPFDSGLVMYPNGHARCTNPRWRELLDHKFSLMAALSSNDPKGVLARLSGLGDKSPQDVAGLYSFDIKGL
jgi:2-methylcitrate dehydratase